MATLEIEGAERGWLATVALDATGRPVVRAAASAEVEHAVETLVRRLLEEPVDGRLVGEERGEALLHKLADVLGRRRPLLDDERVFGYVHGARQTPARERPPGWDAP